MCLFLSFLLDLKNLDFFGLDKRKAQIREFIAKAREKRQSNGKQNILRGLQLKELERTGRKELRRISAFQIYVFGISFPPTIMERLGNAGMQLLLTYHIPFPFFQNWMIWIFLDWKFTRPRLGKY